MAGARSYLFVPANRPERFSKALASGADAVIVDMEDAVVPAAKAQARDVLHDWLQAQGPLPGLWVRINAADTEWYADDVRCFGTAAIAGLVLPKTERSDDVDALRTHLNTTQRVLPLVETAMGMTQMRTIAGAAGVERLAFGSIDLQVDLGVQCDESESELTHLRLEMTIASRLARIAPPLDGVTTRIDDAPFLTAAVARARRLGFGAKLCIHPRQVALVNQGFLPSAAELEWARAVMAAVANADGGAIALNGRMIDKPVIMQAQAFLQQAGE